MEKLIVDRIEEGIAVLEKEDGTHITISLSELGLTVSEGDIINFYSDKYFLNETEKADRRNKILEMQRKLAQKSKKE